MGSGCCRCLQVDKGTPQPRKVACKLKIRGKGVSTSQAQQAQRQETKQALCRNYEEQIDESQEGVSTYSKQDEILFRVQEVVKRRTLSETQRLWKNARPSSGHKSCQIFNEQQVDCSHLQKIGSFVKMPKRMSMYLDEVPAASSPPSAKAVERNKSESMKVVPVGAMKQPVCPPGKSNANSALHSVDFNYNEIKHPESRASSIFESKILEKSILAKVQDNSYPVSSLASFIGAPSLPALKKRDYRKVEKNASWNLMKAAPEAEQQYYSVGAPVKPEAKKKSDIRVERAVPQKQSELQDESESDIESPILKAEACGSGAQELKEEDSLDDDDDELSGYWDKRQIVSVLSYNQNLGSYIQDMSSQKQCKSQPGGGHDDDGGKKKRQTPRLKKAYKMPQTKQKRRSNSVDADDRQGQGRRIDASMLLESPDTPMRMSESEEDSALTPLRQPLTAYASNTGGHDMEMGIHFDVPPITKQEQVQTESADYQKKLKKLLTSSGQVNGCYYPLWDGDQYALNAQAKVVPPQNYPFPASLFQPNLKDGAQAFAVQVEDFQGTLKKDETACLNQYADQGVVFNPMGLTEGALSTNPVLCALISIANYERNFHKKLMEKTIVPVEDHPANKSLGRLFRIKMLINGAPRSVLVSSEVPVAQGKRLLCSGVTGASNCMGPALIEKAILEFYEVKKPQASGYSSIKDVNPAGTTYHYLRNETPGLEISRLVGWVPEQLSLENVQNQAGIWLRLKQNFLEGNTMLSLFSGKVIDPSPLTPEHAAIAAMSTPKASSGKEFSFTDPGLAGQSKILLDHMTKKVIVSTSSFFLEDHWYSVLDAQQPHQSIRLLKLRSSLGSLAPLPKTRYFVSNQDDLPGELEQQIRMDSLSGDGVFWMEWKEVMKHFTAVSLSWNPNIYKYQAEIHSQWRNFKRADYDRFLDQTYSLEYNPQLLITIPPHQDDFEVRVFFQRHLRSYASLTATNQDPGRAGLNSTLGVALQSARMNVGPDVKSDTRSGGPLTFSHEANSTLPIALALQQIHPEETRRAQHIGFKLFSYENQRVVYPHDSLRSYGCSEREITSDVFIFENSPCEETYVLAILKGENFQEDESYTSFSVQFLSFVPLTVTELVRRETRQKMVIQDFWNLQQPGGSILSPQFVHNPQYRLVVQDSSLLQIKAQAHKSCSLMVMLMDSGKDVSETPFEAIVKNKNPGFYFSGFTYMQAKLNPGEYTLVLATQQGKQIGDYKIQIARIGDSSPGKKDFAVTPLTIESLPHKYMKHGFWTKQNSKGTYRIMTPHFQSFLQNPGFKLQLQQDTSIRVRLRALDLGESRTDFPSLSIAIYEILEDLSFKMIQEDDGYAGRAWGHFSPPGLQLKKNKNGYLLLCINFQRGSVGRFECEIQTDTELANLEEFRNPFMRTNTKRVLGKWNTLNAGGCSSQPTFFRNPQYQFMALEDGELYLELTSLDLFAVGIAIFQTGGKPILECDAVDISKVSSNSTFLVELNTLRTQVTKGQKYTIVVSTYKPKQTGFFDFVLSMDSEFDVKELEVRHFPNVERFHGVWSELTNYGSEKYITTDFQPFLKNPNFFIKPHQKADLRAQLYTSHDISICLDFFEISEGNKYIKVKDSGTYSPYRMGVFINHRLKPSAEIKGYLLVCSTYETNERGTFTVNIESVPEGALFIVQDFTNRITFDHSSLLEG